MGFYSIYKILKDMLRTLFGKRFLKITIIAILIFTIFFVYNECFAITSFNPNFQYNGLTFTTSNVSSWSSGINSSPFTGSMDKMVIFRTNIRNNRNGRVSSYYTFIRCSYPLYLTSLNTSDSPLSTVYSKNDNTNTYFKYATSTESKGATNIRLGPFNDANNTNLMGAIPSFDQALENPNNPLEILYSDVDIYINDEIHYQNYTNPSLGNTQSQLENLSFSNFIINANSYTQDIENNDGTLFMLIYNRSLSNSQTTDGLYPIKEIGFTKGDIFTDYENSTSENMIFKFPIFMSGVEK